MYFRDRLLQLLMVVVARHLLQRLRLHLHQHQLHIDPLRTMYVIRTLIRRRSHIVARLELLQWRGMLSASVRTMRMSRWLLLFLTRINDHEF